MTNPMVTRRRLTQAARWVAALVILVVGLEYGRVELVDFDPALMQHRHLLLRIGGDGHQFSETHETLTVSIDRGGGSEVTTTIGAVAQTKDLMRL